MFALSLLITYFTPLIQSLSNLEFLSKRQNSNETPGKDEVDVTQLYTFIKNLIQEKVLKLIRTTRS